VNINKTSLFNPKSGMVRIEETIEETDECYVNRGEEWIM
jgi:hypothetical protein